MTPSMPGDLDHRAAATAAGVDSIITARYVSQYMRFLSPSVLGGSGAQRFGLASRLRIGEVALFRVRLHYGATHRHSADARREDRVGPALVRMGRP